MMIDNEVSFTSLCYITVDYEGRIWLNRLADVEDDILHTPFKSERTDNYFENRDRLYRNDGPTALGTVGIWEWTARKECFFSFILPKSVIQKGALWILS